MSERSEGISLIKAKLRDADEMFVFWRSKETKEALAILNQLKRAEEKNLKTGGTEVSALVYVPQGYNDQGRGIKLIYDTTNESQANLLRNHEIALSEAIRVGNNLQTASVIESLKEIARVQDTQRRDQE